MILYIIYFLLSPVLWVLTMVISLFNEKIQIRQNQYHSLLNKSIEKIKATNKSVLLFHAASNGELEQIKPIFRIIDRERYFIFLTISSPSSFKHISENDVDTYCYQAFDFPWTVNKFFKIIRPDKYIITRHDIWPHHIVISKLYCKNIFLINANLPKYSKRSFPIVITLYKYIFRKFDCIYTVSKLMGNKLEKIVGADKIRIIGDTRFDQINYRFNNNESLIPLFDNSKNILFGSIDNNDLPIIFKSLNDNHTSFINTKLIFVPHEPTEEFMLDIERQLMELKITSSRLTNIDYKDNKIEALIVDKIGILAEAYKFSSISYIGCGFGKGVHNVIEPAIYGNMICFGPNYEILNEAIELVDNKLASSINNANELSSVLKLINEDDKLNKHKNEMKKYLKTKSKFSDEIIKDILCNFA